MPRLLVMTVIGPDRPGLVDVVAGVLAAHGGNWLESRMSRLGGQFAGILRAEVPEDREPALRLALKQLEQHGLTLVICADTPSKPAAESRLNHLEIVGQDRPGIVSQISHALAAFGVNVEELHTECASAAMSGETMFRAQARLSLPANCDTKALRRELEKIAEDLIVEISLAELKEGS